MYESNVHHLESRATIEVFFFSFLYIYRVFTVPYTYTYMYGYNYHIYIYSTVAASVPYETQSPILFPVPAVPMFRLMFIVDLDGRIEYLLYSDLRKERNDAVEWIRSEAGFNRELRYCKILAADGRQEGS